jgi:hypothetical protein
MNPITGITQVIGSFASILGIGGSLANQAIIIPSRGEPTGPSRDGPAQSPLPGRHKAGRPDQA